MVHEWRGFHEYYSMETQKINFLNVFLSVSAAIFGNQFLAYTYCTEYFCLQDTLSFLHFHLQSFYFLKNCLLQVKELRSNVEKEKKQVEKEKKEKERLLKKAEKLAEKAEKKKK